LKLALVTIAVAAIGILVCGCSGGTEDAEQSTGGITQTRGGAVSDSPSVETASADAGMPAAGGAAAMPVLIDLGADKCVPCKMMAPILDEMKETFEGQLDVRFIDVWKDAAVGREYGVKVIPTQIFFDTQGKELFRHQGFFSREDILAKWTELGYEFTE